MRSTCSEVSGGASSASLSPAFVGEAMTLTRLTFHKWRTHQLPAERLPRSMHLRGDGFRRMTVSGRGEFTPRPTAEATAQLRLRHRASAEVADPYARAGWTVVVQDVVLGAYVDVFLDAVTTWPLYLGVLAPRPDAVAAREAGRGRNGHGGFRTVDVLDGALRRDTLRRGLRLDMSDKTAHRTADRILAGLATARVAG